MSGFNSINNLGTYGRNKFSIGIGSRRSGSGSMARVFNYCNKGSTDLNVVFNCTFNTNYFTPNDTPIIASDYYLTGTFYKDPLIIEGSDGNTYFSSPAINTETGNGTAYIIKNNSSGIPQWATKIGFDEQNSYIYDSNESNIVADTDNNIYISGLVTNNDISNSHNLNFYNTGNYTVPGIQLPIISYERLVYIAKYNTNGSVNWATYIARPTGGYIDLTSVFVDSNHNVYVTFTYDDVNDLIIYENGNSSPVKTYTSPGYGTDFNCLVKYNSNGKYQWSTIINSATVSLGSLYIYCDTDNNIIASGFIRNSGSYTVDIYNQNSSLAKSLNLTGNGIFIAKYNQDGFVQWTTQITDRNRRGRAVVSVDSSNNIYLCAHCNSASTPKIYSANGLGDPTLTYSLPAATDWDMFLVKYNSNGLAQWYSRMSGQYEEYQPYISTNSNGNIIVAGITYSPSLEIYDSVNNNTSINITQNNDTNLFLANFNSNGILIWGTYLGPTFTDPRAVITCDKDNNILVTGNYQNAVDNLKFYKPNGSNPIEILSIPVQFNTNSDNNTFLVKYNANGLPIWYSQTYFDIYNPCISNPYKPWV